MLIFKLFIMFLLSVQVKVQIMEDCDPSHNCLTCMGVPHDCKTCPKGFYLARGGAHYTCRRCPSQCKECEYFLSCTVCHIKNHYGRDCLSVCSKGCLNSVCDQLSGTCLCKDNYEGGHCDYCKSGKYDYDFDCSKDCPANCKTCVSDQNCTECKDSYFGKTCDLSCPEGCYFGKCSKGNGTCYQNKCRPNFEGLNCNKCSPGRFGKHCKLICPENCVACTSDTKCDTCKVGYWGKSCQNNCSPGCIGGVCSRKSGMCQSRKCRSGFGGRMCNRCISGKHGFNCKINETKFGYDSATRTIDSHPYFIVALLICFVYVTGRSLIVQLTVFVSIKIPELLSGQAFETMGDNYKKGPPRGSMGQNSPASPFVSISNGDRYPYHSVVDRGTDRD